MTRPGNFIAAIIIAFLAILTGVWGLWWWAVFIDVPMIILNLLCAFGVIFRPEVIR